MRRMGSFSHPLLFFAMLLMVQMTLAAFPLGTYTESLQILGEDGNKVALPHGIARSGEGVLVMRKSDDDPSADSEPAEPQPELFLVETMGGNSSNTTNESVSVSDEPVSEEVGNTTWDDQNSTLGNTTANNTTDNSTSANTTGNSTIIFPPMPELEPETTTEPPTTTPMPTTTTAPPTTTPMPTTQPVTTPKPLPVPFVLGAIALLGPAFENISSPPTMQMFEEAALYPFQYLGEAKDYKTRVLGYCRVRGDGCKLAPEFVAIDQAHEEEDGRRVKVVVDGAIVHFMVMGYEVANRTRQIMESPTYGTRLMARMIAMGIRVLEVEWREMPYVCPTGPANGACNVTQKLDNMLDDWFDVVFEWGELPAFDLVKDSFFVFVAFGGIVVATAILWITIKCQQWRMGRRRKRMAKAKPQNPESDKAKFLSLNEEEEE